MLTPANIAEAVCAADVVTTPAAVHARFIVHWLPYMYTKRRRRRYTLHASQKG